MQLQCYYHYIVILVFSTIIITFNIIVLAAEILLFQSHQLPRTNAVYFGITIAFDCVYPISDMKRHGIEYRKPCILE